MLRALLIGGEALAEFPGGLNRYLHELTERSSRPVWTTGSS